MPELWMTCPAAYCAHDNLPSTALPASTLGPLPANTSARPT